ncbi:phosphatidylinositol-binding protein scs2 [Terramyces sp. JEL0728]|nr:phosphatidylinositol-binding protein scs2 [Terramyces sp. JEL0728]
MEVLPSSELVFQRGEHESKGSISIKNLELKSMYYKIKTTAPKIFKVLPNKGYIAPGEEAVVSVVLHDMDSFDPERKGDKFLIETIAIPDDLQSDEKATLDYLEAAKLAKKAGKAGVPVLNHKLNAVYTDSKVQAPKKADYVEKGKQLSDSDKYSGIRMSVSSNSSFNSNKPARKKLYDDDDECECCPVVVRRLYHSFC